MSNFKLIDIEWPEFGTAEMPAAPTEKEFQGRIDATRKRMHECGLTHLVIYSDREHFANLHYLTNFDPRFEEALLILSADKTPILLMGNECESRLTVSPLYASGMLRSERYQPFSLLSQPKDDHRQLQDILTDEGIQKTSRIGSVGWKYYSSSEHSDAARAIEIPAFIVDSLRELTSYENVVNTTSMFMNPKDGLRTRCSVDDIAFFEYTNILASEGMANMMKGIKEGITDFELAQKFNYNGIPLNCHITMSSKDNEHIGLTGPTGCKIVKGAPFSSNFAYWGSNTSRCGWVAEDENDLPVEAKDYIDKFVGPYFEAMNAWFKSLTIGTKGGDIYQMMMEKLPYDLFHVFLNPGHLIHMDEWVSSPIYKDSTDTIESGMVFQADVIPDSKVYSSTRMEDGYVVADTSLQESLKEKHPKCYDRCIARRDFMCNTLGLDLPDEVLPLSNMAGIIVPFLLNPNKVITLK